MATAYKELYNSVYSKIKDYDFIQIGEGNADDILHDYIRPAIVAFESCNQDLSDRDEILMQFNFDLSDIDFEILSNYMVIAYLDATYIRTPLALQAHMSTTDFHKYDNSNVLGKVIEVRDMYKRENKQLMINYSFKRNSDFAKVYQEKGYYDAVKKGGGRSSIQRTTYRGGYR